MVLVPDPTNPVPNSGMRMMSDSISCKFIAVIARWLRSRSCLSMLIFMLGSGADLVFFHARGLSHTRTDMRLLKFSAIGPTSKEYTHNIERIIDLEKGIAPVESSTPEVLLVFGRSNTTEQDIASAVSAAGIFWRHPYLTSMPFENQRVGRSCFNSVMEEGAKIIKVVSYLNIEKLDKCRILRCIGTAVSALLNNDSTFRSRHSDKQICP